MFPVFWIEIDEDIGFRVSVAHILSETIFAAPIIGLNELDRFALKRLPLAGFVARIRYQAGELLNPLLPTGMPAYEIEGVAVSLPQQPSFLGMFELIEDEGMSVCRRVGVS